MLFLICWSSEIWGAATEDRINAIVNDQATPALKRINGALNGLDKGMSGASSGVTGAARALTSMGGGADLAAVGGTESWLRDPCDRLLLDPARSGAAEVVNRIGRIDPERIVYVSCHPGTLARDAGVLVNEAGYTLEAAGIIDMFPHTAHVESIAVFQK